MNAKSITSISFILIGNMMTTYSSIGEGWTAKLTVVFGLIMFFIGLVQFKSFLDEKGASGVNKLIWAAILGIIASLLGLIPLVGKIPAGILNLIAFILQIVGLVNLKNSEKIGKTGAGGVNILLIALTIMIFAGIFSILPLVGDKIKAGVSFIAFILIPFGWVKIQGAIAVNVLSTSSIISSEAGSQPLKKPMGDPRSVDFGEWIYKNKILLTVIVGLLIVIFGSYFLFIKPNPEKDVKKVVEESISCKKSYQDRLIKINEEFILTVDQKVFKNSQDARMKYQGLIGSLETELSICNKLSLQEYNKRRIKYLNNQELLIRYDNAFMKKSNSYNTNNIKLDSLNLIIINKIAQLEIKTENERVITQSQLNNPDTQADFKDIQEFYNALKNAVLTKDMNKVSMFLQFPFLCDYGMVSKKDFLSNKFVLGIKYFEIFTRNEPLYEFAGNMYGLIGPPKGPDLSIVQNREGYWKLDSYLISESRGD